MALSMDFEKLNEQGSVLYPNSYFVVSSFNGSKFKVNFDVSVYENSTKENKIMSLVYSFVPSVGNNSGNIIQQSYGYLKGLDEYSKAIDC